MKTQDWRVEPILLLLFVGIVLYSVGLVIVSWLLPNNGTLFTVLSGVATSFTGAFFLRVNPKSQAQQDADTKPPIAALTETTKTETTTTGTTDKPA